MAAVARAADKANEVVSEVSPGVVAAAREADKANEVVSKKLGAETLAENLTAMLVQIVTTAVTVDHTAGIH